LQQQNREEQRVLLHLDEKRLKLMIEIEMHL
jgi:hypothetical protein